jgi:acetylornithine deacetylase/succinyl-diaminopimelate desuccinylase-like protein
MFYNHYVVQPEEPLELWKSPPFKPEIRDGVIYGRGVSDDKGELVSRLKIAESYLKSEGELPCNVKFCFEGEEETGSVHLGDYVTKYSDLFKADAVVWEYGTVDTQGTPMVTLGVKGMIYLEFVLKSLTADAHSSYAAVLPSAPWRLVRLLNILKDENERILVPGWYDGVTNLAEDELGVLQEMPFDGAEFRKTYGADKFLGGMGNDQAKKALVQRPTGNIAGIWAGYMGPGSKTVLPKEIHAKMDFRLVANMRALDILTKLRRHMKKHGFDDVELVVHSKEDPAKTPIESYIAQIMIQCTEMVYGRKPNVWPTVAGTGPLSLFTKTLKLPTAMGLGVSYPGSSFHAPNEHILVDHYAEAIKQLICIFSIF